MLVHINVKSADLQPTLVVSGYFVNDGIEESAGTAIGRMEVYQEGQGRTQHGFGEILI
jgi:hypothetical protein